MKLEDIDKLSLSESQSLLDLLSAKVSPRKSTDSEDEDQNQNLFVAAFIANKGSVHKACQAVGVSHKLYQRWLTDPLFKAKLSFGKETWIEELRRTAYELAIISKDKDMVKFLLINYAPEEFDSGLRKQLAENQGQIDVMQELSKEEVLESLKNDPMVDYTDPEFWQHIDGNSKAQS